MYHFRETLTAREGSQEDALATRLSPQRLLHTARQASQLTDELLSGLHHGVRKVRATTVKVVKVAGRQR